MYKRAIISVLIVVSITLFIFHHMEQSRDEISQTSNKHNYSSSNYSDNETDLIIKTYVEGIIESRLRSPSSANFPNLSGWSITENSSNKYSVYSYVDAENSFGGETRTYFSLTITINNGKISYSDLVTYE